MEPWARVVETHTAALFFAGDRVFKVKKPVDLDFVDLTSAASRRAACEAEVRLNRRLSPDVYLGVADVVVDGQVLDSAVVMRRLPEADGLATRLEVGGTDVPEAITRVAELVADFHRNCKVVGRELPRTCWLTPRQLWQREIERMRELDSPLLRPADLDQVAGLAEAYAAGREALFQQRLDSGLVRDGHGDLLAADVFLLPDGPRILDCLEFDDQLRICDVLHDIAFLAMDLERLGRVDLAELLFSAYGEATGESHPSTLAHYFVAHRALIRAKVAAIRMAQPGADDHGERPSELMELCLSHLRQAQVRLVLLGGLPGTGKSTLASRLAEAAHTVTVGSDVVRGEVVPGTEPRGGFRTGRYGPGTTDRVYAEMLRRAAEPLARGQHVVLDASWSSQVHREAARALARQLHAVPVEVLAHVDEATATDRLAARPVRSGGSEADAEVRRRMRSVFDDWPEAIALDTAEPLDTCGKALEEALA